MKQKEWQRGIWQLRAMLRSQKVFSGIIAITSALSQEGKTLVTANLGQALAFDKCRVLLVDLNFIHPSLEGLWRLPFGPGISEVLQGTATINECLRTVGPEELYLMPSGRAKGLPLGYWDPAAIAAQLAPLRSSYDFILLDLPAVGEGEGASFTELADQTLMVIAANRTPQDKVSRVLEQIERCRGRVAGLVLNNIPPPPSQLAVWWGKIPIRERWLQWREKFRWGGR